MNRFGLKIKDIEKIKEIYRMKNLNVLGIFSHLCRVREFGEEPNNYTRIQINNFDEIVEKLEKEGIKVGLKHIMNSFGILRFNNKKYDLVRPGLLIYGLSPDPNIVKIMLFFPQKSFY